MEEINQPSCATLQMIDSVPTIPLDTVEHIASFLWEDPIALRHCSVLCRAWYSAVRPYVFRCVTIDSPERLQRLEAVLVSNAALGYWNRELRISGPSGSWQTSLIPMEVLLPGQILSQKLKKLHTIRLRWVHTGDSKKAGRFIEHMSQAFGSTVKHLVLHSCKADIGFFPAFIHAFPLLQVLKLNMLNNSYFPDSLRGRLEQFNSKNPNTIQPLPHLTSFSTYHGFAHDDMDSNNLFHLSSLKNVETLKIGHSGTEPEIKDITQRILPECGHVKTFKLNSFKDTEWVDCSLETYTSLWSKGFAHLAQLRTLKLSMKPAYCDFAFSLLDVVQKSCHQLETISFQVSFRFLELSSLKPTDYAPLDAQLAAFCTLREVAFLYKGNLDKTSLRKTLHELFPRLAATGSGVGPKLRVEMTEKRLRR